MKFNENKFLKVLYKDYKKRNPNFTYNFKDYTFSNLYDGILCQKFKFLKDTISGKSLSYQWTDQAKYLGLIEYKEGSKIVFHFTEMGLNKASAVSNPIRTFYKEHWKWFVGTALSFINILCLIGYRLYTLAQCQN